MRVKHKRASEGLLPGISHYHVELLGDTIIRLVILEEVGHKNPVLTVDHHKRIRQQLLDLGAPTCVPLGKTCGTLSGKGKHIDRFLVILV